MIKLLISKIILAIVALVFIYLIVSGVRQCSENMSKAGDKVAISTVETIKANTEIQIKQEEIETLNNRIDSLEYRLQLIEQKRNENFSTTSNKSIRDSYRDVTDRYIKPGAKR